MHENSGTTLMCFFSQMTAERFTSFGSDGDWAQMLTNKLKWQFLPMLCVDSSAWIIYNEWCSFQKLVNTRQSACVNYTSKTSLRLLMAPCVIAARVQNRNFRWSSEMKAALFPRSLSLYEAWTSRYRWRITSLMLKSPGQGRGWEARRACNKIIRMTLPNRPEKDVLLSANKWGLAAAWPRSFRLMSWRNRQSLSGHNMQRGSSITAPPTRISVSAPARAGSCLVEQSSGLHWQTSRLRIIPYWFAGI